MLEVGNLFPKILKPSVIGKNIMAVFEMPVIPINGFEAQLQTTIVPQRGVGSPTFTRASTAYVFDWESIARLVLSGEVRFQGARRVYNLIPAAGTGSASLAVSAAKTITVAVGTYIFSMGAESTGTAVITFTGTATGSTGTLTANATNRTSKTLTITGAGDIVATCTTMAANNLLLENVTGQSNQNPSEYVSIGVVSAPYHGAGVDGVKYFKTLNGNTVASNVVTEATGAAITNANSSYADANGPFGYWAEGARADVLGTTAAIRRTMTDVGWVVGATMTVGSATGLDGVASAGTSLTAGAVSATNTILFTTVLGSAARTYSVWVRRKTGTGTVSMTDNGGTNWTALTLTTTYQLFQVTRTQANPIVGFKIDTNLDAIEVDFNTIEAASFANPTPIPVNVSKAVDSLTITITGNISTTAFACYAEGYIGAGTGVYQVMLNVNDGSDNNRYQLYRNNANTSFGAYIASGGVQQLATRPVNIANGVSFKSAMSADATSSNGFVNGTAGTAAAGITLPTGLTTIRIGDDAPQSSPFFGAVKNVRIWQQPLTSINCIILTR